jgi:hypothetical protein
MLKSVTELPIHTCWSNTWEDMLRVQADHVSQYLITSTLLNFYYLHQSKKKKSPSFPPILIKLFLDLNAKYENFSHFRSIKIYETLVKLVDLLVKAS